MQALTTLSTCVCQLPCHISTESISGFIFAEVIKGLSTTDVSSLIQGIAGIEVFFLERFSSTFFSLKIVYSTYTVVLIKVDFLFYISRKKKAHTCILHIASMFILYSSLAPGHRKYEQERKKTTAR